MARKLLTDLDVQSNKIINLATPTASTDAATKGYVDSASGGGGGNKTGLSLGIPGTLAVGAGTSRVYFVSAATITNVVASVGTQSTGASIIFDVKKNGATIFTTTANRPTIAVGTNADLSSVPDVATLSSGDYLTVDIIQVGSTAAGADAIIQVVYT